MKTIALIFFVIVSKQDYNKYCKYVGYDQKGDTLVCYTTIKNYEKGDTIWKNQ